MNIDVSKIEGYAEMSPEDKVKALEGFDIPENTEKYDKLKKAYDVAASDAASWKKQLREKQTEQERADAERVEREKARDEEMESLREKVELAEKRELKASYINNFLTVGYSQELAEKSAEAKLNGNSAEEFNCLHLFIEEQKKAALQNQPNLSAGANISAKEMAEKEQYAKMRSYFGLN